MPEPSEPNKTASTENQLVDSRGCNALGGSSQDGRKWLIAMVIGFVP